MATDYQIMKNSIEFDIRRYCTDNDVDYEEESEDMLLFVDKYNEMFGINFDECPSIVSENVDDVDGYEMLRYAFVGYFHLIRESRNNGKGTVH